MKKLMEILGDKRELCRLLNEHKDMLKKAGIVVLVIVLGLVVSAVKNGGQEEAQAQETTVVAEEETADVIYVDVGGEVNQPSVVELTDGSRVTDAIAAAGGLTEKADLTDINRAAFVSDGEKIFIPSQKNTTPMGCFPVTVETVAEVELQEDHLTARSISIRRIPRSCRS